MALTETEKKSDKREKPLTKVIIRRLPPTIDQDTFLKQVSPIPDYNYIYTVNGDSSLGENSFSRVYINFVNHEDVYNFKERFDSYVFLDNKGNEYSCVVEFAAFQKIPKKRGKARMDPKAGSIESDPYYVDFLENLKKPQELDEKPEYTLQLNSGESKNDMTTPLLEFIKNKRAQRMRIREVRREERKRREFDKRREHYEDRDSRKKVVDEKSPIKKSFQKQENVKNDKPESEVPEEKSEKEERYYEKSYYKNKDRRYDDRRFEERRKEPKPRFPKKEYPDYKSEERKEKKFEYPRKEYEAKTFPKKVKKYSEKREERKLEAQKAEQKKVDEAKSEEKKSDENINKTTDTSTTKAVEKGSKSIDKDKKDQDKIKIDEATSSKDVDRDSRKKEESATNNLQKSESQNQKRIRNKDRPTIAIYRPGMLSKRKQNENDGSEIKEKAEDK